MREKTQSFGAIDSSAENSWLGSDVLTTGKCQAGHYEYIFTYWEY